MSRQAMILSIMLIIVMMMPFVGAVKAVSEPNVVVTLVYWGTNALGGISVHPGDTNIPLSIVLSNAGDAAARDVTATLVLASPFTYAYNVNGSEVSADTAVQSAGDIQAGYSFTVRYALTVATDAIAGIHRLTLVVDYKTSRELLPVEKTLTVDVPVWTGDVRVQHVSTVPGKVYPGDNQVTVRTWLVNSGTGSTADLQVRLLLQDPFQASSGGSNTFFLGTMQPGQVSEADFYVDISNMAQFGSYNLKLATFPAEDGQVEIGQIPIYVSEKVIFDVVQVEPKVLNAGDSGVSIKIAIKNTGTVAADSVRAQLMVGNFFSGTLTDFLGTMQPGETKTAYLTVDVDSRATSQVYKMDLRLDWTQSDNSLDSTLPIQLQVAPAELPLPLIAVAVILLVLVVAVLLRRRRKVQEQKSST